LTAKKDLIMHRYRTHTCGALTLAEDGADVRLSGWCHRIRDHGGVLFIDLRDHYGLTQCVAIPTRLASAQPRSFPPSSSSASTEECASARRAPKMLKCRPGLSKFTSVRSKSSGLPATCRCRCSATSPILRTPGSGTGS